MLVVIEKVCCVLLAVTCLWWTDCSANILSTKHNLSVEGSGVIHADSENRVCIFCHTPHHATSVDPLWNRSMSAAVYNLYGSSTLVAQPGQPTGMSRLCLSCHDGTIAIGMLSGRSDLIDMSGGISTLPLGQSNLETDLSDDHPISFVYDSNLAVQRGDLVDPMSLPGEVRLENGGLMQCTSCHNPHKNPHGMFLVLSQQSSELCLACHDKDGWLTSTHSTEVSLADSGCRNCHQSHGAPGVEYLLKGALEEQTCTFACHNSTGAGSDILSPINEFYRHPVEFASGVHQAGEDPINAEKHVECVDCHSPHTVNHSNAPLDTAPDVNGRLAGVSGVSLEGGVVAEATYEYEICFKCHAENDFVGETTPLRMISSSNEMLRFDKNNPSFHPVVAQGKNLNVPSLRPEYTQYTESSQIYCSDCHGSERSSKADGVGADGPHGSIYPHILIAQYQQDDYAQYSFSNYALCFRCHDPVALFDPGVTTFGNGARSSHRTHVTGHQIPCSACHDPHGVPVDLGGNEVNNLHLINFDLRFVDVDGVYSSTDKSCTVSCHSGNNGYKTYDRP